jgi:murein DD-endopeptidase MepM/ murein hydrolase activator NlpD
VEVAVFTEPIPYETIFEDDPNVFTGENTTRVAGILGEREIRARVTRLNGVEQARETISVEVLSEASSAIVVRGTRPLPPRQGTGELRHPLPSGRFTSGFGMRWGRMHRGIDLAAPRGTAVRAADGGTVTFAGYRGAMGNLIIINHGAGMETYYAHLNRIHVSRGQSVHRGQHIGDVGSTGRSTGPHLHFEVHIHGQPRNPLNFL